MPPPYAKQPRGADAAEAARARLREVASEARCRGLGLLAREAAARAT